MNHNKKVTVSLFLSDLCYDVIKQVILRENLRVHNNCKTLFEVVFVQFILGQRPRSRSDRGALQ